MSNTQTNIPPSTARTEARTEAENALHDQRSTTLDYATILGVIGGFAIIIGAMILGGSPGSFLDAPSLLIVFGGTFLVTTTSFSLQDVIRAQSTMFTAVAYHAEPASNAALQSLFLADNAKRQGILSLQKYMQNSKGNKFLNRGMIMLQEGYKPDQLARILLQQAQVEHLHKKKSASILRRAGEVSPAMGLIGTLVGLVQMLSNLDDPGNIGPSMAIALLTTFYGAILANMIFHPVAAKLERLAEEELLVNQIYCTGLEAISRQENPRRLETLLNTLLPTEDRVHYYD